MSLARPFAPLALGLVALAGRSTGQGMARMNYGVAGVLVQVFTAYK